MRQGGNYGCKSNLFRALLILGNRAAMFPGSKVVGNVHVGNNVVIVANSVVINDIPDNCIVGGIPARILSEDSSSFFIGRNNVVF